MQEMKARADYLGCSVSMAEMIGDLRAQIKALNEKIERMESER